LREKRRLLEKKRRLQLQQQRLKEYTARLVSGQLLQTPMDLHASSGIAAESKLSVRSPSSNGVQSPVTELAEDTPRTPIASLSSPISVTSHTHLIRCSACGEYGHMKSNRTCPLYIEPILLERHGSMEDINSMAGKEGSRTTVSTPNGPSNSLLSTPGSSNGLILKLSTKNLKKSKEQMETDYLMNRSQQPLRRRRSPQMTLNNALCNVFEQLKGKSFAVPFERPVPQKCKFAPDYYDIVKNPMDLSVVKNRLRTPNYYRSRADFLRDIQLIHDNCVLYNRERNAHLPPMSEQLLNFCTEELKKNDDQLLEVEKEIEKEVPLTPRTDSFHRSKPNVSSKSSSHSVMATSLQNPLLDQSDGVEDDFDKNQCGEDAWDNLNGGIDCNSMIIERSSDQNEKPI